MRIMEFFTKKKEENLLHYDEGILWNLGRKNNCIEWWEKWKKKYFITCQRKKIGKSDNFIVYFQSNLGLDSDLKIGISFTWQ